MSSALASRAARHCRAEGGHRHRYTSRSGRSVVVATPRHFHFWRSLVMVMAMAMAMAMFMIICTARRLVLTASVRAY